jgi:hypothetical protein
MWLTQFLQCAIPVFDGLLPEPHNSAVLQLLFISAHWHGLAKLRMHTDHTLDIFDDVTVRMGAEYRKFNNTTCRAFETRELARETKARKRRREKKNTVTQESSSAPVIVTPTSSVTDNSAANEPLPKVFNLNIYKFHALGDYPRTIREFGTSDSYSTEPVGNLT